jgi:hypothetical protein
MHEKRETSPVSARATGADRRAKASRTARMQAGEEAGCGVVPIKHPNNERRLWAEGEEGSSQTKENASESCTPPAQSGKGVSQG